MKPSTLPVVLLALAALAAAPSPAPVPAGTPDSQMGLSRTSVFDAPTPGAFSHASTAVGKSLPLPRAFPGAPPQVSHRVARYLPITRDSNQCADCHDDPDRAQTTVPKGEATPMPLSHYDRVAGESGALTLRISGRRHECVMCHVPQTGAPDLVGSTFTTSAGTKPGP
jgi:cytochrome c-type protein NapB